MEEHKAKSRSPSKSPQKRGRIKFNGEFLPPEPPKDLICEECEHSFATQYCNSCLQVFCDRCLELAHPLESANEKEHKHKTNLSIRPIQYGDKSKIKPKNEEFQLPDTEIFDSDYMKIKDISKPNSLSINKDNSINISIIKNHPIYRIHDLVMFEDPHTLKMAYGKIISEWSDRHGITAPVRIRGEDSSYYYIVQFLSLREEVDDIDHFLNATSFHFKFIQKDSVIDNQAFESIPMRDINNLTRKLNKRIKEFENILTLGPKYHLRDLSDPKKSQLLDTILNPRKGIERMKELKVKNNNIDQHNRSLDYDNLNMNLYADIDNDDQSVLPYGNPHHKPIPANNRSYLDYLTDKIIREEAQDLPINLTQEASNILVLPETKLSSLIQYVAYLKERKDHLLTNIFDRNELIWLRVQLKIKFTYWKNNLEETFLKKRHFSALKIQTRARVWLCRNKLEECHQFWDEYFENKRLALHSQFRRSSPDDPYAVTYDNKHFFKTRADINRYSHILHVMLMKIIWSLNKKRLKLLQKTIQVWRLAIYDFSESSLQNDHVIKELLEFDKVSYSEYITSQKTLFISSTDEKMKIKQINKRFIESIYSLSEYKTDITLDDNNESNLDLLPPNYLNQNILNIMDFYDDNFYESISSIPLMIRSEGDSDLIDQQIEISCGQTQMKILLPTYDISKEFPLPVLPKLEKPKGFKDKLYSDIDKGLGKISNKAWNDIMKGPTDESYWLVPNSILIGNIPFGFAQIDSSTQTNNKLKLSAISSLLLTGINVFISVISPHEEQELEEINTIPDKGKRTIAELLQESLIKTKRDTQLIINENIGIITKQESQLNKIPNYGKTDPRYPAAYREKLRCQARIEVARNNIKKLKGEIKNLPNQITWCRLAIAKAPFPWNSNHLIPALWEIEQFVRQRKKIYIYSGGPQSKAEDGLSKDGLSGLIVTTLMAKMYKLEGPDALYRWQRSHDAMSSLRKFQLPEAVNVPPLPWQRQVIINTITSLHRPLELPTIRTQLDPESLTDLTRHPYYIKPTEQEIKEKYEIDYTPDSEKKYIESINCQVSNIFENINIEESKKRKKQSLYFKND